MPFWFFFFLFSFFSSGFQFSLMMDAECQTNQGAGGTYRYNCTYSGTSQTSTTTLSLNPPQVQFSWHPESNEDVSLQGHVWGIDVKNFTQYSEHGEFSLGSQGHFLVVGHGPLTIDLPLKGVDTSAGTYQVRGTSGIFQGKTGLMTTLFVMKATSYNAHYAGPGMVSILMH